MGESFVETPARFDLLKAAEVVGREHLTLHDRERNFYLIEPTGMNRRVHYNQIGVSLSQTTHGGVPPVRGAVIDALQKTRVALR